MINTRGRYGWPESQIEVDILKPRSSAQYTSQKSPGVIVNFDSNLQLVPGCYGRQKTKMVGTTRTTSSSTTSSNSDGSDASTRSTLINFSNADLSRSVPKPVISVESKVFWKEPYKLTGTRVTFVRPSIHDGKLAQLMDMPMDIFLEVMALLHPQDLLNLSRISKHFRKILMHRSSKGMWVAARKNANNMPAPPDVLSEPKYASLLFERECQACGISRAGKVNFAICLRLCGACWKENVSTRFQILRAYKEYKPIADTLLSLIPFHTTGTGPRMKESYYEAEFEAVADRYTSLSGAERDRFVEERRAYVKIMQEHAQAVIEWQNRVWDERHDKEVSAVMKRKQSIYDKLFAMGYTEDQFPRHSWDSEWESLVYQPRELTDRIWSQILPKLEDCIADEALWRAEEAYKARRKERQAEVHAHLHAYLAEASSADLDLLPPYPELMVLTAYKEMIDEDEANVPVTRERFDAVVPAILKQYSAKMLPTFVKALQRALHPEASDEDIDTLPAPNLESALAMFPCRYCEEFLVDVNYTLSDLKEHMKEVHLQPSEMNFWTSKGLDPDRFHVDIIRQLLKMLGLPENTRYQDISGRVVCLCGKHDFEQPVSFSTLLRHIMLERKWHSGMRYKLEEESSAELEKLYNDHDWDISPPFLKLLADGETYTPPQIVVPEGLQLPADGGWCSKCGKWAHNKFRNVEEYVWHVRAKHHEEPTEDGLIPGPY